MTLREIAKEAGVSISTVSRVINHTGTSAAGIEVQNRIWEIVRRTGYSPNTAAVYLKKGQPMPDTKVHTITCILSDESDIANDSFFSSLTRGILQETQKHGYQLKYTTVTPDLSNARIDSLFSDNPADGALIIGSCNAAVSPCAAKHFHSVVSCGLGSIDSRYDQIICDGFEMAVSAMDYLISSGHTHIAYIGVTARSNCYEGYCSMLTSKSLPIRHKLVSEIPAASTVGGYLGARNLLKETTDFTAIFCPNDIAASGVIRAMQEARLRIPRDISLISIGNIDQIQRVCPMLTSIHIPMNEMGRMAVKMLIDRIEGGHHLPLKIMFPHYIVKRESCGQPRKW